MKKCQPYDPERFFRKGGARMIRIAVAEDDLSWAHQLQTYVDQYARESGKSFEVSLFADGEDLLEQYHGQFDLVF